MYRLLAVLGACLFGLSVNAIEQPPYRVIDAVGDVEIRRYDGYLVAQTTVTGDFSDAGTEAFRPLLDYISGDNEAGQKISMTAPVEQHSNGDEHRVTFMMPSQFDITELPEPIESDVSIATVNARTVAVLTYSGGWQEKRYLRFAEELRIALADSSYTICGEPVWARYNPPFWPSFLRRNEIQVSVSKDGC